MDDVPLLVLAAPGTAGAGVAAALGDATGRPVLGHDEVDDVALDQRAELRTICRRLLWVAERDWACADGWSADDGHGAAAGADATAALAAVCGRTPAPVLHDVALPFLLPAVADAVERVTAVVVVGDPQLALPRVVAGTGLPPGAADDLLRAAHARLRGVATGLDLPVVDVDAPDASSRLRTVAGAPVTVPTQDTRRSDGVEPDPDVRVLRELAAGGERPLGPVATDALAAAAAVDATPACDRFVGPRTAARRSELHALVAPDVTPPVLECTRATGLGAATAGRDALEVASVDSVAALRRAVTRPFGSVATVVMSDLLSWCTRHELEVALRLAADLVAHGGSVVVGTGRVLEEERAARGMPTIDEDEVERTMDEVGLLPVGRRAGAAVGAVVGSAQSRSRGALVALHGEVQRLEAALAEARSERDRAQARFESLRQRRSVRAATTVAEGAASLVETVRARAARA